MYETIITKHTITIVANLHVVKHNKIISILCFTIQNKTKNKIIIQNIQFDCELCHLQNSIFKSQINEQKNIETLIQTTKGNK